MLLYNTWLDAKARSRGSMKEHPTMASDQHFPTGTSDQRLPWSTEYREYRHQVIQRTSNIPRVRWGYDKNLLSPWMFFF